MTAENLNQLQVFWYLDEENLTDRDKIQLIKKELITLNKLREKHIKKMEQLMKKIDKTEDKIWWLLESYWQINMAKEYVSLNVMADSEKLVEFNVELELLKKAQQPVFEYIQTRSDYLMNLLKQYDKENI